MAPPNSTDASLTSAAPGLSDVPAERVEPALARWLAARARRLFGLRTRLVLASAIGFAAVLAGAWLPVQVGYVPAWWPWAMKLGLVGVVWLWGLLLLAYWFHPIRGTLGLGRAWLAEHPALDETLRAYCSAVLALWFATPAVLLLTV